MEKSILNNSKIFLSTQTKDKNFLASHDLCIGIDKDDNPKYKEIIVTIADVVQTEATDVQATIKEKKDVKKKVYALKFKEPYKPYILNATIVRQAIEQATGTRVLNKWIGKRISFYVKPNEKAFGKLHDVLRVRPTAPKAAVKGVCSDCDGKIVDVEGFTAEQIANGSMAKYGRYICFECGQKLKNQKSVTEMVDEMEETK